MPICISSCRSEFIFFVHLLWKTKTRLSFRLDYSRVPHTDVRYMLYTSDGRVRCIYEGWLASRTTRCRKMIKIERRQVKFNCPTLRIITSYLCIVRNLRYLCTIEYQYLSYVLVATRPPSTSLNNMHKLGNNHNIQSSLSDVLALPYAKVTDEDYYTTIIHCRGGRVISRRQCLSIE